MSVWDSVTTGLKSVGQKAGKLWDDVSQMVAPEDGSSKDGSAPQQSAARDVSGSLCLP